MQIDQQIEQAIEEVLARYNASDITEIAKRVEAGTATNEEKRIYADFSRDFDNIDYSGE